ncbi:uncharacterized protein L969DRAFT_76977 [Mixia osmundae IAM 14324]|uniref:uncharacterized protein n=1 Tax=Mixia osmundae (strain CBS 9802 / IAM 14324 / JCM 22182 / KY 12970) TaxID=764103 RepID=UPI0004A548CA|nr:uncharacterized protein L969DRAFT_76977 [Mixia osmundae IAM 14324]KEI37871.1 hypothetical protein L969DRAFT_76977 [Mixia osmundae IAM 14324]
MSRTELAQPSALLQHDVDLKAHLDSLHTSLLYNLQALAQHNRERRRDLNEEQQAHAQEVDRLQTQLSAARTKAQEMLAQIEAEQRDIKSASNAVASLQLRERALNDSLALSEADVQEMSTKLDTRQSELDRHRVLVRHHASLGAIELKYLQQATGLSIKPTGRILLPAEHGQVKIEFRLVDPADFARPFSLILATTSIDRSMPKYAIVSTSPPLDRTLLGTQEAALNRSRELGPFLAAMRRSFVASVEADRAARTS